jgi:alkylhydroperoxidase family enzyme
MSTGCWWRASAPISTSAGNAIVAAAAALTETPISFGPQHIDALREVGLDDEAIVDVINAASFFNWANRPDVVARRATPAAA